MPTGPRDSRMTEDVHKLAERFTVVNQHGELSDEAIHGIANLLIEHVRVVEPNLLDLSKKPEVRP